MHSFPESYSSTRSTKKGVNLKERKMWDPTQESLVAGWQLSRPTEPEWRRKTEEPRKTISGKKQNIDMMAQLENN